MNEKVLIVDNGYPTSHHLKRCQIRFPGCHWRQPHLPLGAVPLSLLPVVLQGCQVEVGLAHQGAVGAAGAGWKAGGFRNAYRD